MSDKNVISSIKALASAFANAKPETSAAGMAAIISAVAAKVGKK